MQNWLEDDIVRCDWLLAKIRSNDGYAQNLYAAWCNNDWAKTGTDDVWGVSWRRAGTVIADLRHDGDYMDWYCSGMLADYDDAGVSEGLMRQRGFVAEGCITEEILSDLAQLGWQPVPGGDWEHFVDKEHDETGQ